MLNDPRVAGRRPANAPAEDAPAEEPAKPAPRRRAASTRRSAAQAEPAEAEQAEATPAPRRRRGAAAAEAAEAPEAEQAEAKPAPRRRRSTASAEPAEPEQAEAKPPTRRRRSAAAAEPPAAEPAEAKPATPRRRGAAAAEPAEPEQAEAKPAPRRRRSTASAAATEAAPVDATALAAQVQAMGVAIEQQTRALEALREQQERASRKLRLGVFVDVPNLIYGAERGEGGPAGSVVHMGRLLDFLSSGRELIRATAYSPVSDDPGEPVEQQRFVAPFVPYEYRIVTKPLKRFADGSIKGNFDVEMAIDMVTMTERLDVVALVSGDADFSSVVELLQSRGVRVEVIAFSGSTSIEMRALADHYIDVGTMMDRVGV